ncbi:sulfatase [Polaribacter sp. R77954]|uniref:sulfatase n=1 Tax=Polaribacter sp. R77954 TaxID=3093870 RepID=UPI0037CBC527
MKNHFYKISLFSLITFLAFGCTSKKSEVVASAEKKPNIIFFIADDMYPWMFNNTDEGKDKNGKPKNLTPTLDKMAKEGVWLENMKVVSPVCTPSRYNTLTGNYASRATNEAFTGFTERNDGQTVIQWNAYIAPGDKTMGTYFQDLGYKTGFVGKNHIIESLSQVGDGGEKPALDADPNDPKVKAGLEYRYNELQKDIKKSGFDYADKLYHNNPNWLGIRALAYQNMDWIAEGGVEFIKEYKDNPFMLYIASTLPHAPLQPKVSWKADRRITPKGILNKAPNVLPQPAVESIKQRIKAAGLEGKNKENILWLDDAVGALFNQLEKEGVLDNTIVVFFNDHGQDFKGTLYEGGVNSQAFIWKKGGFKVGNTLEAPVSNVDFLPTLLDFAGKSFDTNFDGKSFKPALEGKKYEGRTSFYHELGYARAVVKDGFKYYAVRYPKWAMNFTMEQRKDTLDKYTKFRESFGEHAISDNPNAPFGQLEMVPGGGGAEHNAYLNHPHFTEPDQLYDLKNDPEEKVNLINDPKYAEKLKELKAELKKYIESLPGKFEI